jgi:hypothetical protein
MSIVLVGSTSGSITLQEPAVAGTTVLDLPATSGTVVTTGDNGTITQGMLATAASSIGVGQTWQNVTGSRVSGTTYTNSTGKPIFVYVQMVPAASGANYVNIFINGVALGYFGQGSGASSNTVYSSSWTVIIPSGDTYRATIVGSATIDFWFELR